jgi:hypothetical protein
MQVETQLMDFIAPSPGTDEVPSVSRNLIDSSLEHLHGLMKQVGEVDVRTRTSPAMIQAVCNVSKQITNLMQLKLAIVKVARGQTKQEKPARDDEE